MADELQERLDHAETVIDKMRDFVCCKTGSNFCGWEKMFNKAVNEYDSKWRKA